MKKILFVSFLLFTLAYPVGVLVGSHLYQGEWTLYHRVGAYGNYPAWYRERWPGECYGNFCRRARLYSVYAQSLWAWDPFRYVGKWDRWYAYIPEVPIQEVMKAPWCVIMSMKELLILGGWLSISVLGLGNGSIWVIPIQTILHKV